MTESTEGTTTDLLDLLNSGSTEIALSNVEFTEIAVLTDEADTEEVKVAKSNIEFSSNTIRETIVMLKTLAMQSGNPRYFEAIATLLNTLNGVNNQLMGINRDKAENKQPPSKTNAPQTGHTTIYMTTQEAMRAAKDKVIDG